MKMLSISKTLNIKRLNSPIKRHRVAQWKKKKKVSAYKTFTSAFRQT